MGDLRVVWVYVNRAMLWEGLMTRFIQIHALTSYPGALLNRDDAGFAKRLPFGGVTRTRVSSQCLKRHWRVFKGKHSLGELERPSSVRSRLTFEHHIIEPLVAAGMPIALTTVVTEYVMKLVLGESAAKKREQAQKEDDEEKSAQRVPLKTSQITVIGQPEVAYLRSLVEDFLGEHKEVFEAFWDSDEAALAEKKTKGEIDKACKAAFQNKAMKKNIQGLKLALGLDAALFGRMVTSDILARGDAAVHVAHALTVHAEHSESDYFSAVDEILANEGGELGSGHINSTELTSGLFYLYVVLDVPLLVSNLTGCDVSQWQEADRSLAADVASRLVRLIATVSPGAKLGSTAPHSYASCVMVEAGDAQPRTLANAFFKPVSERGDMLENTYRALADHLEDFHGMYGKETEACLSARGPFGSLESALGVEAQGLNETAQWVAQQIEG